MKLISILLSVLFLVSCLKQDIPIIEKRAKQECVSDTVSTPDPYDFFDMVTILYENCFGGTQRVTYYPYQDGPVLKMDAIKQSDGPHPTQVARAFIVKGQGDPIDLLINGDNIIPVQYCRSSGWWGFNNGVFLSGTINQLISFAWHEVAWELQTNVGTESIEVFDSPFTMASLTDDEPTDTLIIQACNAHFIQFVNEPGVNPSDAYAIVKVTMTEIGQKQASYQENDKVTKVGKHGKGIPGIVLHTETDSTSMVVFSPDGNWDDIHNQKAVEVKNESLIKGWKKSSPWFSHLFVMGLEGNVARFVQQHMDGNFLMY